MIDFILNPRNLDGGNLYNWGIGTKGVLASGTAKHLKSPLLNDAIHHLSEHDGIKVVKIKAGGDSVLALFGYKIRCA